MFHSILPFDTEIAARDLSFCVVDFETLAFPGVQAAEPWQIGVVRLEKGVCQASWESYLRPTHAEDLKKMQSCMPLYLQRNILEEAPFLHQIWPDLKPFLERALPVAHQLGTEKKWLAAAAPMLRLGPWIDTLKLARKAWPKLHSYTLENVVNQAGIINELKLICPNRPFHDALFDAFAAAFVLRKILDLPGWRDLTLSELTHL